MNLPQEFLDMMKIILGDDFSEYEKSFDSNTHHGLRLNTSKISAKDFDELTEGAFIKGNVEWCDCGFYYDSNSAVTKSPYYHAGLYYIQEPSAMLPAAVLPVEPGDKVLDLCAAPGGKSTQLAAKLRNTGFLMANDISNTRAKALLKNLELFGLANIAVSSENHEKLASCFPEYFDKILVDAPCSGEGMFRREPSMVNSWLDKGPDYYAAVQADILEHAYSMLKPGGMLLYSTCTFSPLENEANIYKLLKAHDDIELVPINITKGMRRGLTDSILMKLNILQEEDAGEDIFTRCARIFPQDGLGEGHFAALIKKKSAVLEHAILISDDSLLAKNKKTLSAYPKAFEFFTRVSDEFIDKGDIREINDKLYLLPRGFDINSNVRYLRTGLLLGELIKKSGGKEKFSKGRKGKTEAKNDLQTVRFEPSQALAMALDSSSFVATVDFKAEDLRVIKYLKGETIECPDECIFEDGWCLVTVDSYPLGFAIKNNSTLKNKYYPGWRLS